MPWKQKLKNNLKGFKNLVIMCVGNQDAYDDGAGPELAIILSKIVAEKNYKNVFVLNCQDSPENFTSIVKKIKPTHILIIDCCIHGKRPGSISVFLPEQLKESDVSSHRIPLKLLCDYLSSETKASIFIAGIEPQIIKKEKNISKPVKKSIDELVKFFSNFLNEAAKSKI